MRMRLAGEHFFARFTFTHPGLIRLLKNAAEHLGLADAEERRVAFERLARLEGLNDERGRPVRSTRNDAARATTLAMIARLSEAPVVCTQEERRLFELLFERVLAGGFDTKMTSPSPSGCVPDVLDAAPERDAFVVWAPAEPAWRTALAAYALDGLHLRAIVVCRDGALPNVGAQFVRPQDAGKALSRARAVLDLSVNDPGDALALAKLGLPLAVSYLSGAYELLDGVAIYRPWMQSDIELAALTALGLSAARPAGAPASAPAYCEPATTGAPVALSGDGDGAGRQTYTAIVTRASATYAAQIPRGARVFDTHVATLVEAIERSGADRAVSDALRRTAEPPGYVLVSGAFSLTRVQPRGSSVVCVPRVTGVLTA